MSDKGTEAETSAVEKYGNEGSHPDAQHVGGIVGDNYVSNAARGTEIEHELTFTQAAKKYPAAIGWTVVVCIAWYDLASCPSSLLCHSVPSLD